MASHASNPTVADPARTRRIELILRQIDALPTLPTVATRLLALTSDDDSEASQIVDLIRSDQALTSKILSVCRRADVGICEEAKTLEKAVVLLGFNAVRSAVLSIKVFEIFDTVRPATDGEDAQARGDGAGGGNGAGGAELDRVEFWRHCLAVGVAAELIAQAAEQRDLNPGEAFVCGLLHDVGKLAMDFVLPKSFGRVVELVDINQGNIAEFERRIIGIDHHTAGKRLAEQWGLPHLIQDCIWLHGCPFDMLPRLEHRRMIGLISLADLVVRKQHVGYSGNFNLSLDEADLTRTLGLDPSLVESIIRQLHSEVDQRSKAMGLDDKPSQELFLKSIQQANQMLGRLNTALDRRGRLAQRQAQMLEAIAAFHSMAQPGRGVEDALAAVARSAANVLGHGFWATVHQHEGETQWMVCQFDNEGRLVRSHIVDAPAACSSLTQLDAREPASLNLMGIMPNIADCLIDAPDMRQLRLLPLGSGWGTAALLVHDRPALPPWAQLLGLTSSWGAAIAATAQHDGARRLGEELAQVNRALAEAQDRLAQSEAMTRLGEMAAGAAHEMNNPLAVISGRAQLLAQVLERGGKEQQAAVTIAEQAHRLSDMISFMRLYADPPRAQRQVAGLNGVLDEAVKTAQARHEEEGQPPVEVQIEGAPLEVSIDGRQVRQAVAELVLNALQSAPAKAVRVAARLEPTQAGQDLVIEVSDDGGGMDAHTQGHAFAPFFSNRAAGRRMGFGLPRALLMAQAHGGQIDLRSTVGKGTTAILRLPLDLPV